MQGLGLGALAHANWHANYMSFENKWWSELSVLQAAHAGEVLIKSRIAQEHPLLIFETIPKASGGSGVMLSYESLIEGGRTFQFSDLPDRLWASTGIRIPNLSTYKSFGKLRNTIQHFSSPVGIDVGREANKFIYEVIDPFINECWGLCAVDFNEDTEHQYLVENLIRHGIKFIVSEDTIDNIIHASLEFPKDQPAYKHEMLRKLSEAALGFGNKDVLVYLDKYK